MAERIAPDAIISSSGLDVSGGVGTIQDDPDSPDGNWFTTTAQDGSLRVSFPTPSADPQTGAGVQEFRVLLRKDASGGGTPTYSAELRETGGGTALQTLATNVSVTSTTGQVESLTWDASNLGTADGSAVELVLTFTHNGGGPNERNIEVGAVEWNATVVTAGQTLTGTPAAGSVVATIGALLVGAVTLAGSPAVGSTAATTGALSPGVLALAGSPAVGSAAATTGALSPGALTLAGSPAVGSALATAGTLALTVSSPTVLASIDLQTAGPHTTGSFTPSDNALLVVTVGMVSASATISPSISDSEGLTWTLRKTIEASPVNVFRISIYTAQVGASPASMTVTVDDAGSGPAVRYTVEVAEYTGHNQSSPVGATGSAATTTDSLSITLSGTPASGSKVHGGIGVRATSDGTPAGTPGDTKLADYASGAPTFPDIVMQTQYRTGGGTTVSWTNLIQDGARNNVGVAVEIKLEGQTLSGSPAVGATAATTGALSAGAVTMSGAPAAGVPAVTTGVLSVSSPGQTLDGAPAAGASAATSGTLAPGGVTAAGQPATGAPSATTGSLIPGARTIPGSPATGSTAATTGSLTAGAVTLAGSPATASTAATTGALSVGGVTLAGQPAAGSALATDGTLSIAGAPQTLDGSPATGSASVTTGALSPGAVTASGSPASGAPLATTGALSVGGITLSGQPATNSSAATSGTLSVGSVNLAGQPASGSPAATSGALLAGGVTISGSPASGSPLATTGTLVTAGAPQTMDGAPAAGSSSATAGMLTPGVIALAGQSASGATAATSGALTPGAVTLAGQPATGASLATTGTLTDTSIHPTPAYIVPAIPRVFAPTMVRSYLVPALPRSYTVTEDG